MANIVVVDEQNNEIGAAKIEDVYRLGLIHRIVRMFLFNSRGEMFLQQRSYEMVGSPGLWDQSVGGHVDEGETTLQAAKRETKEEIGLEGVDLHEIGTYYTESNTSPDSPAVRRFNILYTATSDNPLVLDPSEIASGKWVSIEGLEKLIRERPQDFTRGLIHALEFYKTSSHIS